ncbi:MAG: hypothetical protein HY906_07070 [Deltaproteobacteria bacterium]|nr:hypothetical protein [Deltaproteobacteria bacterium]
MKVQCELCREIVPLADFTPSAEGLEIRCPACHGTYFVPAPRKSEVGGTVAPSSPVAGGGGAGKGGARAEGGGGGDAGGAGLADGALHEDEVQCPKCGRGQPPGGACRHCGLVFALWDPASAAATAGDDEARGLFAEAESAWDDPARHDAFIQHCGRAGQLPYAARCYRDRLARDPDDAVARAQQAKVVTVAELSYLTRPRELADAPMPCRGVLVGAVLVLFLVLLGLLTSPLWRWWK